MVTNRSFVLIIRNITKTQLIKFEIIKHNLRTSNEVLVFYLEIIHNRF